MVHKLATNSREAKAFALEEYQAARDRWMLLFLSLVAVAAVATGYTVYQEHLPDAFGAGIGLMAFAFIGSITGYTYLNQVKAAEQRLRDIDPDYFDQPQSEV